jgi:hypothetical protein
MSTVELKREGFLPTLAEEGGDGQFQKCGEGKCKAEDWRTCSHHLKDTRKGLQFKTERLVYLTNLGMFLHRSLRGL